MRLPPQYLAGILLALGAFAQSASAQTISLSPTRTAAKIAIHHADPWMVKAMLEGMQVNSPEIGSIAGLGGVMARAASTAAAYFQDGYLVVNPTDNSLWYFPKKH